MALPREIFAASQFRPWGAEHWAVIILTFFLPLAGGWWSRRKPDGTRARTLALSIATVLLVQLGLNLIIGWSAKSHWTEFMPLHLCHLALFACVDACLTRRQFSYELAYFWGLGGTLQGLLTPGLQAGFPSPEFVLFFLGHGGIVAAVLFLTVAFQLRPHWHSVPRAYLAILGYALVAGVFDALTGQNYGFLRTKPDASTLFDLLGPWPWYIGSAAVLCGIIFVILYLPWAASDQWRSPSDRTGRAGGHRPANG